MFKSICFTKHCIKILQMTKNPEQSRAYRTAGGSNGRVDSDVDGNPCTIDSTQPDGRLRQMAVYFLYQIRPDLHKQPRALTNTQHTQRPRIVQWIFRLDRSCRTVDDDVSRVYKVYIHGWMIRLASTVYEQTGTDRPFTGKCL